VRAPPSAIGECRLDPGSRASGSAGRLGGRAVRPRRSMGIKPRSGHPVPGPGVPAAPRDPTRL